MSTTSTDPDAVGTTTGKDELDKWNWGAFLWGVVWAFGHRLWKQALIGLVITIVTLGIGGIGIAIWYALKGNRWIWERGGYGSKDVLRQKERKWAWAYLWVTLAWIALYVAILAAVG
jgi:hypothetical protein